MKQPPDSRTAHAGEQRAADSKNLQNHTATNYRFLQGQIHRHGKSIILENVPSENVKALHSPCDIYFLSQTLIIHLGKLGNQSAAYLSHLRSIESILRYKVNRRLCQL